MKEIDIIRKKELLSALKSRRMDYFTLLGKQRGINGQCSLCDTYLESSGNRHCSQCPAGEKICDKFVKKRIRVDKEIREMVRYLDIQIKKVSRKELVTIWKKKNLKDGAQS